VIQQVIQNELETHEDEEVPKQDDDASRRPVEHSSSCQTETMSKEMDHGRIDAAIGLVGGGAPLSLMQTDDQPSVIQNVRATAATSSSSIVWNQSGDGARRNMPVVESTKSSTTADADDRPTINKTLKQPASAQHSSSSGSKRTLPPPATGNIACSSSSKKPKSEMM
jgi:hypothetical protein